jgi:hypothetical protein
MTAAGNAFVADIVFRSIAHPVDGAHAKAVLTSDANFGLAAQQ